MLMTVVVGKGGCDAKGRGWRRKPARQGSKMERKKIKEIIKRKLK